MELADRLSALIRDVLEGEETAFDVVKEIVGEGADAKEQGVLEIRRRKLNPEPPPDPVKAPSPKRTHSFADAEGFAAYLAKYGSDNTVVLANPVLLHMDGILDERAERGFERVGFDATVHPLFDPWDVALAQGPWPLRDFTTILAQNRRSIIEPDGRELVHLLSQIRVSKKVEIRCGVGSTSINGMLVETKIAGEARTEEAELPERITICCPVFLDTAERTMEIDLLLLEEGGEVYVQLSSTDAAAARLAAFGELLDRIKANLDADKTTFALGRAITDDWRTL
ncbi:MAG TPA: DUF2303 family protein [Planctomycetota bacterium]|nr:DUF2303 family protein [Planctomycetota bacterium]